MEDFYEAFIKEVQEKIDHEQYEKAYFMLEEELAMPYIPKAYEEQMISLYNICYHEYKAHDKRKQKYDEEDIVSLLQGNVDEACQAVDLLKGSNIRRHLQDVEAYLCHRPHFLIRSLLVEALVEQEVTDEVKMNYDGLDVTFIPSYVSLPKEQETLAKAVMMVRDFYENENPTFLMMCVETMMKEAYFKLPFALEEDELLPFVYAVLQYVYRANEEEAQFTRFIHEKNLAKYGGYGLLLCRYEF